MRLKLLELQGYKTFASRTEFAFDGGITAIVGPNGSGKSNVADAIRWVLGEQSFRTLRAKRTEDMIFSGSAQRARLGMASASLTLDNRDEWLPVDFSEVVITRRAYRSGENEYLLNRSRVRLRDIGELLARSGLAQRTYTVIGQGLVDAVLSLRAEDRRALFEEAAGITLYQAKRADALARLDETRSNLLRVNDIINETEPRLHRLERDSARVEQHALLSDQLEGLLRTWYGYRWRQGQLALVRAADALRRRTAYLQRQREALDGLEKKATTLRTGQSQLRDRLGGWHRESGDLHRRMEELQRDLAVLQERSRLQARQADEIESELVELEIQLDVVRDRLSGAEADLEASHTSLRDKQTLADRAAAEVRQMESERDTAARALSEAQARALDVEARLADGQARRARNEERLSAQGPELGKHRQAFAQHRQEDAALRERRQGLTAELERLEAADRALLSDAERLRASQAELQAAVTRCQIRLREAERAGERLQARFDLLARLRQEGEGLHEGVRALLRAAARPSAADEADAPEPGGGAPGSPLAGIRLLGTVGQLLEVPEPYEVAIEAALGPVLQELVVESWEEATHAIAFLVDGARGRATLLPLELARPSPRLEVPAGSGIVGLAADFVSPEPPLAAVVELLLGRTLITRDLAAARHALDRLPGDFQIVTLAGELLRSRGSVTGGRGAAVTQGGIIAREREWRGLSSLLASARGQAEESAAMLAEAESAEREVRTRLAHLEGQRRDLAGSIAALHAQRRGLGREADHLAQQIAWRQGVLSQLEGERAGLHEQNAALEAERVRLAADREQAQRRVEQLRSSLQGLQGTSLYGRLSEARTAAAVARGVWEHRQTTTASLRESQGNLEAQVEAKRARVTELQLATRTLGEQIEAHRSRETVIRGWLSSLTAKIHPAEDELAALQAERDGLDGEAETLRVQLRDAESRYGEAVLAHSRQEDRMQRLHQQIVDDLGLVEMEPFEGLPEQPPLPFSELVSALPSVDLLPAGLDEEIHRLRAQIRRLGPLNPNAPDEYAETLDRYRFLRSQVADLEEAANHLRDVIAELDVLMRTEFQEVFDQVASGFKANFTRLFGGGTARLVLTLPGDLTTTGVEIVARPPGKRQQTLALLSGGERSLTAVALIFALLQTRPPPFCVLDEVDAMLDESNVRRFRQMLVELSAHTQFIVITHNRTTIEAADTIYGVSMGDDSVSQVVSLRLDGDRITTVDSSA